MQHLENILRFFKSKGGADTPGPSPRSATDFVPTQKQKTEQNLGPILGFSKNKLRFFTGTNSDFRRRQSPISKNQTPIFKNKLRFSKKKPLIFNKNKFRFSKKQTPIFKKTNSDFQKNKLRFSIKRKSNFQKTNSHKASTSISLKLP